MRLPVLIGKNYTVAVMEKPIVFLSHSSKNKRELTALKQLLDRKAVGFIDFFLSSDGESIPLGTNWVQRLNEALKKTKLMFVFVSRDALQPVKTNITTPSLCLQNCLG